MRNSRDLIILSAVPLVLLLILAFVFLPDRVLNAEPKAQQASARAQLGSPKPQAGGPVAAATGVGNVTGYMGGNLSISSGSISDITIVGEGLAAFAIVGVLKGDKAVPAEIISAVLLPGIPADQKSRIVRVDAKSTAVPGSDYHLSLKRADGSVQVVAQNFSLEAPKVEAAKVAVAKKPAKVQAKPSSKSRHR